VAAMKKGVRNIIPSVVLAIIKSLVSLLSLHQTLSCLISSLPLQGKISALRHGSVPPETTILHCQEDFCFEH